MGFIFPIAASLIGPISSGLKFGANRTTTAEPHGHEGVDLAWGNAGSPVFAAADGVVSASNAISGLGGPWGIYIDHDGGWQTRYLHLANDGSAIAKGSSVSAGQQIGVIGNLASGPHVHFEVRANGTPIDPETVLEGSVSDSGGNLILFAAIGGLAYWLWHKWRY